MKVLIKVLLFSLCFWSMNSALATTNYFFINHFGSDSTCATYYTTKPQTASVITADTTSTTSNYVAFYDVVSSTYKCLWYNTYTATGTVLTVNVVNTASATSPSTCTNSSAATTTITCSGACSQIGTTGNYATCYYVPAATPTSGVAKVASYTDSACTKLTSSGSAAITIATNANACTAISTTTAILPNTYSGSSSTGTLTFTLFNGSTGLTNKCQIVAGTTTVKENVSIACATGSKMSCTVNPLLSTEYLACVNGAKYLMAFLGFFGLIFIL